MSNNSPHRRTRATRRLSATVLSLSAFVALALLAPLASGDTTTTPVHVHPAPDTTTPTAPAAPQGQPPPDTEPPPIEFYARKKQDVDSLLVTVWVHEPATVEISASASRPGSASRTYALRAIKRSLPPHVPNKLRLKFQTRELCVVKRALKSGKRMSASVTLTARDAAGNATTATKQIALKREKSGCKSARRPDTNALLLRLIRLMERSLAKQGTTGTKGATGATGVAGTAGATGADGRSALTTLGPLETERGTIGGQVDGQTPYSSVAFSATLPIPAPFGLDDDHVQVDVSDESANDECQGTAAAPTAAPGYVCIYPYYVDNVDPGIPNDPPPGYYNGPTGFVFGSNLDPSGSPSTQQYGFQLSWFTCNLGSTEPGCPFPGGLPNQDPNSRFLTALFANWAYTAPANAPEPSTGHHH